MNPRLSLTLRLVVLAWVLFSLGYIVLDQWHRAVNARLEEAFGSGRKAAVQQIVELGGQCQPVSLSWSEGQMTLTNAACAGAPAAAAPPPGAVTGQR
jgi:hypothetical protein